MASKPDARARQKKPRAKTVSRFQTTDSGCTLPVDKADDEGPEQGPVDFYGRREKDTRARVHKTFCRLQDAIRRLETHSDESLLDLFRQANDFRTVREGKASGRSYIELAFRLGCEYIEAVAQHLPNDPTAGFRLYVNPTAAESIPPKALEEAFNAAREEIASFNPPSTGLMDDELASEASRLKSKCPELRGLPPYVVERTSDYALDVFKEVERLHELASEKTTDDRIIAPGNRTKPMSYREAAKHIGKAAGKGKRAAKDAAEWLKQCIDDGIIACERITRQNHVFDKNDFPESAWKSIMPSDGQVIESGPKWP
jgi:hypothetical protein